MLVAVCGLIGVPQRALAVCDGGIGAGGANACHVSVGCVDTLPEKRSVVLVAAPAPAGTMKLGSGVLLNNFDQNGVLYVMTVAHLIDFDSDGQVTPAEASAFGTMAQFGFGYEADCAEDNATTPVLVQGSSVVAADPILDLALLQLTAAPEDVASAMPYYAGWEDVGAGAEPVPQFVHLISHPCHDVKMVSGAENPDFCGAFLCLDNFECGGAELGSSGGPFFDTSERAVFGLLSGFREGDIDAPFDTAVTCAPETQVEIVIGPYNGFGAQFLGGGSFLEGFDPFA